MDLVRAVCQAQDARLGPEGGQGCVPGDARPAEGLDGAVEDAQLILAVGYRVAQGDRYPEWKPGTEFKARRDAMMQRAAR